MLWPGGCFTNISQAPQNNLSKFVYDRNGTSYGNFKLKLCTCAQSHALGSRTKFQLEIVDIIVFPGIVYFRKIIFESSRNVSETTLRGCCNIGYLSETRPKTQILQKVSFVQKLFPSCQIIF